MHRPRATVAESIPDAPRVEERPAVLVVEDDPDFLRLLERALGSAGFETVCAGDAADALAILRAPDRGGRAGRIGVVVSDLRMPSMSGLELIEVWRSIDRTVGFVLMTAFPSVELTVAARRLGTAAVLAKPFPLTELVAAVGALAPRVPAPPSPGGR